jgi:hypothetical protein
VDFKPPEEDELLRSAMSPTLRRFNFEYAQAPSGLF